MSPDRQAFEVVRPSQDERPAEVANLLIRSAVKASDRRFTGEPQTDYGALIELPSVPSNAPALEFSDEALDKIAEAVKA